MLFLGYWSIWFLVGVLLMVTKKIRFTMHDKPSFLVVVFFAFIMAIPSSLAHCAFIK